MSDFKAKMHQIHCSPDSYMDLRGLLLREGRERGGEWEGKRELGGEGGMEGREWRGEMKKGKGRKGPPRVG